MKKLFIVLILSGVSYFGFGQDLQFGLKAGATLGYFDNEGKKDVGYEPRLGFAFGGMGKLSISNNFFIKSELGYAQLKTSFGSSGSFIKVNRIELIPLVGYGISEKIDIEIGPEISYLLKSTFQDKWSSGTLNMEKEINLGFNLGSTFMINSQLSIYTKYSIGLLHYGYIYSVDEDVPDLKAYRVSSLSLGVNYYFKNSN